MNLLFFTDVDGNMVAVNPEYITFVEVDVFNAKTITMIYFTAYKFAVQNPFDEVVSALNGWRKKV